MQVDINTYAGIDEVGRGPLAGPVVAAAVVLGDGHDWKELRDSKMLSAKKREACAAQIRQNALAWSIGRCEPTEIDQYNIFNASLLAMQRAFEALAFEATLALVDGKFCPQLSVESFAVIKGDQHVPAISAASILAKVTRDSEMCELDKSYPNYGFAKHKGYPTAYHMEALKQHGPCSHHRKSFKPVANVVTNNFK
ncbi:MAG: ribonuclease HII [Gammaproteobacteria bacterium]|nr:ribonuclease HII [Gammaproteobacteria bacterium]